MKTIKTLLFLAATAVACGLNAQEDTVQYMDPWYLFHPKPKGGLAEARLLYPKGSLTQVFQINGYSAYSPAYTVTPGMVVYGVAFNMDTTILASPVYDSSAMGVRDTNFQAMLYYPGEKENCIGGGIKMYMTPADSVAFYDSVVTEKGEVIRPVRRTYFRHDLDTLSDHRVDTCWEFYFKTPLHITAKDSFLIGNKWGIPGYTYFSQMNPVIAKKKSKQRGPSWYTHQHPEEGMYLTPYPYVRVWEFCFPIVKLRCTEPREWKMDMQQEGALFSWRRHDEAEFFEVEVVNDSTGDSTVYLKPDWDTTYTLSPVDSTQQYRLRVRKLCRYTTEGYDTLVYSDWSAPIVIAAQVPPVDTTTTDTTTTDTTGITTTERLRFSVRPNPAGETAEVTMQYAVAERAELTLLDMQGRVVRRRTLPAGTRTATLELGGLPSGAYLLKVVTPQGLATRRLLKR